jgi:hypothetical protein
MQYARAAWYDSNGYVPSGSFFKGRAEHDEIRQYSLGKQSVDKYKKVLLGDDAKDNSWMNVNWDIVPIIPKFREIAISRLLERTYDLQASAIDALAVQQEDEYFNRQKVKILMRQAAQQMGSPLANAPALQPAPNEPKDMEALQIEQKFGYKHIMATEAEMVISLIMQQNDIAKKRRKALENMVDGGFGGHRLYIDENGMVKFRAVDFDRLVLSYSEESDFSDLQHCGEIIMVNVVDLVPYFTADKLRVICESVAGKYSNPPSNVVSGSLNRYYDKFKVMVMDLEFYSWNTTVFKQKLDKSGNIRVLKTDFEDINKTRNINNNGEAEPKYSSTTKKVVYKTKWLVGTEYMYDYGISENMVRKQSSWWDTHLNFYIQSWNNYRMQFASLTKRMIPIADKFMLSWYKLQNQLSQYIPYVIDVDLDALENVNIGSGGTKMEPMQVLDLLFQKNILVSRRKDISGENINYKSVNIQDTGMASALSIFYQDLNHCMQLLRDITGLNEVTDGSAPNPKMLTTGLNLANQSTNNALAMISEADKNLMLRLADGMVQKVQIAVKLGKVEGYAKSLGDETVKFFQINPDLSLHEIGIFIDDAPSEQERQQLLAELNLKDSQCLIDPADKILVMSCRNLKQAAMLLAYKVDQRRKEQQQFALQQQQANAQVQIQSSQAAEAAKQQTLQLQAQIDLQKINAQMQWQYIIDKMKVEGKSNDAQILAEAKKVAAQINAESKFK